MITKYKIFENIDNRKKFWKVRTDEPYFEASLYKLDTPYNDVEFYIKNEIILSKKSGYVYVAPHDKRAKCSWNNSEYGKEYYEKDGLIYQGEVEITEQDIKDMKIKKELGEKIEKIRIEIGDDIEKYNL